MSRSTFARHFAEATGHSATDFLAEIRMALAGRKVAQTNRPVAEIGEQVALTSPTRPSSAPSKNRSA